MREKNFSFNIIIIMLLTFYRELSMHSHGPSKYPFSLKFYKIQSLSQQSAFKFAKIFQIVIAFYSINLFRFRMETIVKFQSFSNIILNA